MQTSKNIREDIIEVSVLDVIKEEIKMCKDIFKSLPCIGKIAATAAIGTLAVAIIGVTGTAIKYAVHPLSTEEIFRDTAQSMMRVCKIQELRDFGESRNMINCRNIAQFLAKPHNN